MAAEAPALNHRWLLPEMDPVDEQFRSLYYVIIGLAAGSAGKFIILDGGTGVAGGTVDLDGDHLDVQPYLLVFILGRSHRLEGVLHEDGLHIGELAHPEVNSGQVAQFRLGKLGLQGVEDVSDQGDLVHGKGSGF